MAPCCVGIDLDGDGQIGVGDIRIGDTATIENTKHAQVVTQWQSSPDFGEIDGLRIYIGHPTLMDGIKPYLLKYNAWANGLNGTYTFSLTSELQNLGLSGWCYLRVDGFTSNMEYRCITNPIWINVIEGGGAAIQMLTGFGRQRTRMWMSCTPFIITAQPIRLLRDSGHEPILA